MGEIYIHNGEPYRAPQEPAEAKEESIKVAKPVAKKASAK